MPSHMLPLLAGLVGLAVSALSSTDYLAATKDGVLRGVPFSTTNDNPYLAYLGITYATADRFQAAVPAEPFLGVKDATEECSACLQPRMPAGEALLKGIRDNGPKGSDDCLCLNIYTPLTKEDESLLPVMIFIHGGGWLIGSGSYDMYRPDFFMDSNRVVLVTIQYRLHILGFGDFNNSTYPLNLGLKDQALALSWIKRNIVTFRGDPSRITLSGWSCGAASAVIHSRLDSNKGAFTGVIAQSGSPNAAWAVAPRWRSRAATMSVGRKIPECSAAAAAYNKNPDLGGKLAECLANISHNELIDAVLSLNIPLGLVPVVEEPGESAILTEYPWTKNSFRVTVPLLTGTNAGETVRGIPAFELLNNPVSWLAVSLAMKPAFEGFLLFGDTSYKSAEVVKAISLQYQCSMVHTRRCFQSASQDYLFEYPRVKIAEQQNGTPTYVYYNEYVTYPDRRKRFKVPGHGGELPLLYPQEDFWFDGADIETSKKLVAHWISFVEKSEPGPEWLQYDPSFSPNVLYVNKDGSMIMGSDLKVKIGGVHKFWSQLPIRDRIYR